jgi:hypothetical protein
MVEDVEGSMSSRELVEWAEYYAAEARAQKRAQQKADAEAARNARRGRRRR